MKKNNSNNLRKTFICAIILSFIVIIVAIAIQSNAENKIIKKCSYLDPWIIDALSFFASLFLIIEGFARIFEHPNASLKRQFTRLIRIALGFSILTLHIIQLWHKY